jgi:hypothetical protein
MKTCTVGQRVRYRSEFLRSIGALTGPLGFARGTVISLGPLGKSTLATIDWDKKDAPDMVNIFNLESAK